jgi:hypothetical protein
LEIAEQSGDARDQLRILGPLHMLHLRTGEFKTALHYARRCSAITATVDDPAAVALGHFLLGNSLHFCGDLAGAGVELEATLKSGLPSPRSAASYLGFQGKDLAGGIMARNLWMRGHPAQAAARARQTIREADEMDHSLTHCIALLGGIAVSLWSGDLPSAEEHIERLISRAESHSLSPYVFVARGFGAEVAVRRADVSFWQNPDITDRLNIRLAPAANTFCDRGNVGHRLGTATNKELVRACAPAVCTKSAHVTRYTQISSRTAL